MRPYRVLSHTADLGLAAHGRTREELFANAARGLTALLCPLRAIHRAEERAVDVLDAGTDDALLLVAFLSEVLFVATAAPAFLARDVVVTFPVPGRVHGALLGEPLSDAHPVLREVKAVTYHQARIFRDARGHHARVYVDV